MPTYLHRKASFERLIASRIDSTRELESISIIQQFLWLQVNLITAALPLKRNRKKERFNGMIGKNAHKLVALTASVVLKSVMQNLVSQLTRSVQEYKFNEKTAIVKAAHQEGDCSLLN